MSNAYKKCMVYLILTSILFIINGCSNSNDKFSQGIKDQTFSSYQQMVVQWYPKSITQLMSDDKDHVITYNKEPQRIVAVWQNSIETLLALGVGDSIIAAIGVPDSLYISPEYQVAYEKIPYKSMQMPDKESLLYNEPDFILGWKSTFSKNVFGSTDFWQNRGINTYIARSSSSGSRQKGEFLAEEYKYIQDIGIIVNREERANNLVKQIQNQIAYGKRKGLEQGEQPSVLILEILGKELRLYNEMTLAGNIVEEVGGNLLLPNSTNVSYEELLTLNPDVLFVVIVESNYGMENQILNKIYNNPALQSLKVVKNRSIKALPLYAIYSPGIRVKDGVEIIVEGLYPQISKEALHERMDTKN